MMGHTFGGTTTLISSHLRSMSIFFSTFECVKNRQEMPVSACEGNAIQMSRTAKRRQTGTAPIPANKAPSLAFDSHSGYHTNNTNIQSKSLLRNCQPGYKILIVSWVMLSSFLGSKGAIIFFINRFQCVLGYVERFFCLKGVQEINGVCF